MHFILDTNAILDQRYRNKLAVSDEIMNIRYDDEHFHSSEEKIMNSCTYIPSIIMSIMFDSRRVVYHNNDTCKAYDMHLKVE